MPVWSRESHAGCDEPSGRTTSKTLAALQVHDVFLVALVQSLSSLGICCIRVSLSKLL